MKVLSTFNGMGCIWLALDNLNIKVTKRYSSEIDKYANTVNDANYPDTIQLGDITQVKAKDLDRIDLIVGGSPCQGFSFAGKQLNFEDERSKLFFEFVRLYNECKEINPDVKFLLENVNMKREYLAIISKYLGVYPVRINSNLVSAQNRDRWYWTNIKTKEVGLFGDITSDIPQPKDKGILLKDILESEVDKKYYLSSKMIKCFTNPDSEWSKRFEPMDKDWDKSKCLTSRYYKMGKTDPYICVAMRGRNPDNPSDRTPGSPTEQRLEPKEDGKTNTLTSVGKDNLILGCEYRHDEGLRINKKGKSNTLTAQAREDGIGGNKLVLIDYKLRRLTPIECERLQTVPDNYTNRVSDSQRYKMLGNGWTIDVITHILSFLK
jgi:DNA (cytosine-5)-methyltransferase 1